MYFNVSLITLGVLMLIMLFKVLFKSPNIFYKIQSINALTSIAIMFLIIFVYFTQQPAFIDLAFIYIIINYIGIVIVVKYMQALYNNKVQKNDIRSKHIIK